VRRMSTRARSLCGTARRQQAGAMARPPGLKISRLDAGERWALRARTRDGNCGAAGLHRLLSSIRFDGSIVPIDRAPGIDRRSQPASHRQLTAIPPPHGQTGSGYQPAGSVFSTTMRPPRVPT
jgi:hypothetical protein